MITGDKNSGSSTSGILKVCNDELLRYLGQVFSGVWESKAVLQDWCDALLVLVPKKSDLSLCNNQRGITLVGKVFC